MVPILRITPLMIGTQLILMETAFPIPSKFKLVQIGETQIPMAGAFLMAKSVLQNFGILDV